jgi:hypothetical protein
LITFIVGIMTDDGTYTRVVAETSARVLFRSGQWDQALALLPGEASALRTQILADRFWWRLDDPAEAEQAVAELDRGEPVLAAYYRSQLAYTRSLFGISPQPDAAATARTGFAAAAADDRLAGWGTFWLGVVADNLDGQPGPAGDAYGRALDWARARDDGLLESYAVRHLGGQRLDHGDRSGLGLLRRSYHHRAALGARPQTAAAALTLAGALPGGPEAGELREMAAATARELRLTWMLTSLAA